MAKNPFTRTKNKPAKKTRRRVRLAKRDKARQDAATALYEKIQEGMEGENLHTLLALATKAAELCPDHPWGQEISQRLAARNQVFTRNVDACQTERDAGRPEAALLCAQRVLEANPTSVLATQLVAKISELVEQVRHLKAEMKNALAAGDPERALQVAKQLDDLGIPHKAGPLQEGSAL